MKKVILFFFLFMVLGAVQAQIGVKAGINISNWVGDDIDDVSDSKSSVLGPHFGIFYNLKLGKRFSVLSDVVYSWQGVQFESSGSEVKVTTTYLNLSPLFRWNANSGFYIATGPQLGFLMDAQEKTNDEKVDVEAQMESGDFSWVLAAGYELKSGFGIYGRANFGQTSIDEDDAAPSDVKNMVYQVGISYNIWPR